jgi:hypothetical protein
VADFNGDGKADIASGISDMVYMHYSTGTGFESVTWTVPNKWATPAYTWAADFNGDGKADIASGIGGNVYMNLTIASGFVSPTWTVPDNWGDPEHTWVADFNSDGAFDIATASGGNVYVSLSDGLGLTSRTWTVPGNWGTSGYTWVADFNGDAYPDIASASGNAINAIYMSFSRGARFASQVWYPSSDQATFPKNSRANINSSVDQVFAANAKGTLSTPLTQCAAKFGLKQWAKDFDTRRSLSYYVTPRDLGYVKDVVQPLDISTADDGLYIFVMRRVTQSNGVTISLRIRRSDRPDDFGFGVQGLKQYSYKGNIPCPNTGTPPCPLDKDEPPETPNQFVRHSQLNQGTSPVASAGQLQIRGGEIIWISNASGHFSPSFDSLDCVEEYLYVLKIPRARYNLKKNHDWNKWLKVKDEL